MKGKMDTGARRGCADKLDPSVKPGLDDGKAFTISDYFSGLLGGAGFLLSSVTGEPLREGYISENNIWARRRISI